MKEAAGEANMTVVTIILIGLIVAAVTPIVKNAMTNTQERAECQNDGGCWTKDGCDYDCKQQDNTTTEG